MILYYTFSTNNNYGYGGKSEITQTIPCTSRRILTIQPVAYADMAQAKKWLTDDSIPQLYQELTKKKRWSGS